MQAEYTSQQVSKAVTLYLSYGVSRTPKQTPERLVLEFKPVDAAKLAVIVTKILHEVNSIVIDWSKTTLPESAEIVQKALRLSHPELDQDALDALSGYFTWGWR